MYISQTRISLQTSPAPEDPDSVSAVGGISLLIAIMSMDARSDCLRIVPGLPKSSRPALLTPPTG